MKTLLHITAQVQENYGTEIHGVKHDAWKNKGGQMFTLRVDSDSMFYAEEQCLKVIKSLLAKESNDYYRYTYIEHELVFHDPIELSETDFDTLLEEECKEAFN